MPPARLALYVATAGVLATTGYSLIRHPPPVGWSGLILAGYAGLLLAGIAVPRLRVFADALVRGPRGARGVALTFEGGPDPRWTPRVLELLAKQGAKATFFLVGRQVEAHPEVARAIAGAGHAVGLQSYAGAVLALRGDARVQQEVERGLAAIEGVLGRRPRLFRPPRGRTSPGVARVAEALGLSVVGWSVSGAGARPEDVTARVRRDLHDGVIVRLEDAGKEEPPALRALPGILGALHAERLEAVPLTAWIEG
jgi:peptidoglycan/xylan/chitin deacetylase (PgdA/CDA1 family)